jgi:hypothetical protein
MDRGHGFIRRFTVAHAARHDGSQLGAVLDPQNTGSGVWGDVAYRSKANVALLGRRGLAPQFQRAKPRGRTMPAHVARGNPARARVRILVEHVFGRPETPYGTGRALRRLGPRHRQDHARQPRLQRASAGLGRGHRSAPA